MSAAAHDGTWAIRSISTAAKKALFAQQTGEAFIALLTLDHPGFDNPIRVCRNSVQIVSGGNTYLPFPFDITLPDESDEAPPRVTLSIDNVDRQIVEAVRSVNGDPISVSLSVVMASTPNTVEAGPFDLSLRSVSYDSLVVEGQLQYEDILLDAFPAGIYTPATHPGLFT